MGQTTSAQIESHIRTTREELRSNLEQLERRVSSMVDWREQFRRNPALGVGLAVAAGFLLARLTARPQRRLAGERSPSVLIERRGNLRRALGNVQDTMIEIAAARATDILTEFLLGRRDAPLRRADGEAGETRAKGNGRAARVGLKQR
jgi:hypothetical protein